MSLTCLIIYWPEASYDKEMITFSLLDNLGPIGVV